MIFIFGVIVLTYLFYLYGTRNFDYWKSKGVKHDDPIPFLGNAFKQFAFKQSVSDIFTDLYLKYPNERFIGYYNGNQKRLIIREPKDIQRVMVTDFNVFYPRGLKMHKDESDPFHKQLFSADGDLWKLLRQSLTPAFTSEVKAKGKMVGESIEKRNPDGSPIIVEQEMDDLTIVAQVFVLFAAGFETSSSTSSFTLHQLAFHPEAQKKCQDEIDAVLKKYNNKLCYDAIGEMKYLTMAFKESMRMFPSVGVLIRQSAAEYTFPDSNLTIDKDINITIPVHAIQMDERFFEEPKKFMPERFSPENIHKIQNHTYLPFGEGPRACIGERLGMMQSLAGIAAILSKFSVAPSRSSKREPEADPIGGMLQVMKGGAPLSLIPRKKTE
ncbi:hypothetical protein ABMA28_010252 [Loxostege sticticalis]|uniref:unspecific monooxygenase n=1 Tax=Loxostege sticticalis TaxID=481309 RepID=A0ABD0SA72_LOXSC